MEMPIERPTCVIADDHAVIRDGLVDMIGQHGLEILDSVGDGTAALERIRELQPDVAVLDFRMPGLDGMEVARISRDEGIDTKVIIYSAALDPILAKRAQDAGVHGYVGKVSRGSVLQEALQFVISGRRYVDPSIAAEFMRAEYAQLTDKEISVLRLMAEGITNAEIAARIGVGAETIKTQVARINEKFGSSSRTETVALAYRRQLLP